MKKNQFFWDEIISVEELEEQEVYDLELPDPIHHFIANDIVVSNSHSLSYAIISYQTAYLRTKYPNEFVLSVLNNDFNEKCLLELMQQGFKIGGIDINNSNIKFVYKNNIFQTPFIIIKGIGDAALTQLIELQQKKSIESFEEFLNLKDELKLTKINKRVIEGLIKSGGFDNIENNRAKLFKIYEYSRLKVKEQKLLNYEDFINCEDFSFDEKSKQEYDVIGISLNSLEKRKLKYNNGLESITFEDFKEGTINLMYVQILNIGEKFTKSGKIYHILNCCDSNMSTENVKCWKNGNNLKSNDWIYGYFQKDEWGYSIREFQKYEK